MKNKPLTLETEMAENAAVRNGLGMALSSSTQGGRLIVQRPVPGADGPKKTARQAIREFSWATFSNLFLLGCLLGLFVLYCCSCVIHALTLPARKKSS